MRLRISSAIRSSFSDRFSVSVEKVDERGVSRVRDRRIGRDLGTIVDIVLGDFENGDLGFLILL